MTKIISLVFLLSLISTTAAVAAATIEQGLIHCSTIEKLTARLSCFDALVESVAVKQHDKADSSIAPTVAIVPVKKTTKQIFGFENKQLTKTPEKIAATITALRKNPYGLYVITLDNQQVWKQKSASTFKLKLGEIIYIKKGALGSFFLGKDGRNKKIKVKRVK